MKFVGVIIACGAGLGACESSPDAVGDAGTDVVVGDADAGPDLDSLPEYDCWPTIEPIDRGTVTLGAGGVEYTEMSETRPLEYGSQGGYMVTVWPRMTGFIPGKSPITTSYNPYTRVYARLVDSDTSLQPPGSCGYTGWYLPNTVGGYDMWKEFQVVFDTCWATDRLIGARIQLDIDVMDATGSFATERRIITATDPITPGAPYGVTDPSCGDYSSMKVSPGRSHFSVTAASAQ